MKPRSIISALFPALLLLPALLLGACAKADTHPLRGVIVDVYREPPALLVDHEEIPGFMGAMTMRFEVDAATATAVQKGQQITARLRFHNGNWRLDQVQVLAKP